ncbi:ComEC/Rec2 family competence protein [Sphingomonas sp. SUN039]|uniref:ComEC/Rec2 family competence protein n=1 Tax=Sphingomonas sp. SUN039 TaxID=2937787 RepID=UPI002164E674|nr:ComEC/Rec2 family competence protein [Sphingomonas sp. SUN039]UVO53185.1 ComEC/Rec2 family competence protein [Sphingomonas sp. SUN039]
MDAVFDFAPSTDAAPRKSGGRDRVETWLEVQRDQLPLWLPVAFGTGAAAWFALPSPGAWTGWLVAMAALVAAALAFPLGGRARRALLVAGLAGGLGLAGAWWRAESVAAPVLARPVVATFTGKVVDVEVQAAKDRYRVTLLPLGMPTLPPKVRVTIDTADAPPGMAEGDTLSLRARLVGPPNASIPGGYDFSRTAWFLRLGATGKAMGKVERIAAAPGSSPFRARLTAHIRDQVPGSAGGIAAAFATGDRGGIATEDEEAMRASGLTHLLSVSGLHITAVVGAAMFLALRLLALSPWLALRLPLVAISAGVGALAGIGYTLLTGAEVPTIRSCVAAVLIVIGIMLGRQAFTLRLVATGALVVLLLWPEAVVGPSFQLSFAAITSIVALHEWGVMQRLTSPRDEGPVMKLGRGLVSLLATGVVVEAALAPIALYHFHKQGLFGALANIVAIPLTTFVTMPLEAMALIFDAVGLGAPFWWLTGLSLDLLLWIARTVAGWPGAVAALPSVPVGAFAGMIYGGLWLMLWKGRVRTLGLVPFAAGAIWALATPPPDLLVTGDGMHLAVRGDDGRLATLRSRAGDYVRSVMSERFGDLGELDDLDTLSGAVCSDDVCRLDLTRGGRVWRIVATRSRYLLPGASFRNECAAADIVVSDRRLPPWCTPKWLKADRVFLAKTGGLAVTLAGAKVETVADGEGEHPWVVARRGAR